MKGLQGEFKESLAATALFILAAIGAWWGLNRGGISLEISAFKITIAPYVLFLIGVLAGMLSFIGIICTGEIAYRKLSGGQKPKETKPPRQ